MILQALSIYDKKAEVFHPPFYAHNLRDGMRVFHRMLTSNEIFKGYEEDYQLFQIGAFDDRIGELSGIDKPHLVITALACLGVDEANGKVLEKRDS